MWIGTAVRLLLVTSLLGDASAASEVQGGSTIPESLARAGTDLKGGSTIPSGPAPSLGQVLADVDVVVRGTIAEGRSYLSDDQTEVFTDHDIRNPVILYQREILASDKSGTPVAVTVRVRGGTISISGLRYTSVVEALPPLKAGTEALFLLKRLDKRYLIAGDFCGVFQIAEGRLMPLTKKQGFAPELAGAPAVKAEEAILAQLHQRRR